MNHTTVADIMQDTVITVDEDWSLEQLARFFTDQQISGAPVSNADGKLTGVVSLTDIANFNGSPEYEGRDNSTHEYFMQTLERQFSDEEIPAFHAEQEANIRVRDIMTPIIFKVTEDTSIQDAADTMIKGHIHRLLVTRDNQISGIVTALDMLKVIRDA